MADKSTNIIEVKDIRKLLMVIVGNWYIILFCLLVSVVLAYFYIYKSPKIYAAKTQMVLKSDETYPIQDYLFGSLGISGYYGYEKMANERRVLMSTDVIGQVVSKLKMDVSYYIVGRIQTKEVYAGTPFTVTAQIYSYSFYDFPFTLKILTPETYELSYDLNDQHFSQEHKFGEPVLNSDYYILVSKSPSITASTISFQQEITYQFMAHNRQNLINKFKNALEVSDIESTAIFEVTMEDEIPEKAVSFLDTLSKVYIDNSLISKVKVNENTISYIDRQLAGVTNILDSIEDMMENYKEEKNILDLTREQETYFMRLSEFDSKKRKLELQLKSHAYLKNYIISNLNKELLPPSTYIEDEEGYLQSAVRQLYGLQMQINSAMFSSTEKSTAIKEIEYKIELLRNDLLKYINNSEKAVNEKIVSVSGEIAYYEGLLRGVPKNQREMLNITRKMQVNEKMYLYLLEKRAETIIARAGIVSEISIIESAHSIGVVKPDKNKIYYSYMSVGLVVSLCIGFLRMIFFTGIENIEELREVTQLSVVGEIYYSKEAKENYLVVDAHPRSFVTESFRAVRTNLEYLAPGVGSSSKIVLITSNRPGVGKTFCSINLASILAKGGKKVLLMEMDLHKPKIHKALQLTSEIGMSTLLAGKHSAVETIVSHSIENLDVILSGAVPPNASELLLSPTLATLFEYARKHYDYVIIDTPPMGIISDSVVLMKYSDINLFIVNTGHYPKESLTYAENVILSNKIGSFALLLNNVKHKSSGYYYKKYNDYGQTYLNES